MSAGIRREFDFICKRLDELETKIDKILFFANRGRECPKCEGSGKTTLKSTGEVFACMMCHGTKRV